MHKKRAGMMSYASFSEVQQAQNIENVAVPIYIYSYKS